MIESRKLAIFLFKWFVDRLALTIFFRCIKNKRADTITWNNQGLSLLARQKIIAAKGKTHPIINHSVVN